MKRSIFESEHEQFRQTARAFIEREINPHAGEWIAAGQVDRAGKRPCAAVVGDAAGLALAGRPWGVTSAFALWGAKASLAVQEANLANTVQARKVREAGVLNAQAQLAAAEAQQANASAQLVRAQAEQRRTRALAADGSVSQREQEQAESALRQAEAGLRQADAHADQARAGIEVARQDLRAVEVNRQSIEAAIEGARASVQLATIDLDNTRIRAPRAASAGEIGVKLGQYVTPGTQLLALVPSQVWVVANFKEAQTARMAPGQPAQLQVDGLGDARLKGHVEQLAPAMGSEFSVLRADNATGNFTKVPQRLPVRIAVDANDPLVRRLRPGMSVIAEVDTRPQTP